MTDTPIWGTSTEATNTSGESMDPTAQRASTEDVLLRRRVPTQGVDVTDTYHATRHDSLLSTFSPRSQPVAVARAQPAPPTHGSVRLSAVEEFDIRSVASGTSEGRRRKVEEKRRQLERLKKSQEAARAHANFKLRLVRKRARRNFLYSKRRKNLQNLKRLQVFSLAHR